jgi:DNA-binding protein HU-beta
MASKQNISAENPQISVEMGVFALTKRSGRLNVDIGAVLRTRMNTGVLSQADKLRGAGCGGWFRDVHTTFGIHAQHKFRTNEGVNNMAKGITKTQLVRLMAEKLELTNKQTAAFLELLAETAVKETKKSGEFTIPGIGKLVKAERKARIGRNPQTGEAIKIKAKTVVKFRVAKVAKDTIAPPKK